MPEARGHTGATTLSVISCSAGACHQRAQGKRVKFSSADYHGGKKEPGPREIYGDREVCLPLDSKQINRVLHVIYNSYFIFIMIF